jgi:hypothetical protein
MNYLMTNKNHHPDLVASVSEIADAPNARTAKTEEKLAVSVSA